MNLIASCLLLCIPVVACGLLMLNFKITETKLKLLLSFSAAYLLSLSFLHLLPEIFKDTEGKQVGIYILIGFFIQLLLDYFSTGIEHGHIHLHHHGHKHKAILPVSILVGLYLHSFIEGIPVSESVVHDHPLSYIGFKQSLVIGITLHNIPISLAFMVMMLQMGMSKQKAVFYLILFSLMAPLGACFSELLKLSGVGNFNQIMNVALGVVVGIFLHISTTIMFESGENHKYNFAKLFSIFMGLVLAFLIS